MNNLINSESQERCPLCGTVGNNLYKSLKDRLFNVSGEWNIDQCPNKACGLLWLNPMPKKEELFKLYDNYYTHNKNISLKHKSDWLLNAFRRGGEEYIKSVYGYPFDGNCLDKLIAKIIRFNPKWTANLDFSVFYLEAQHNAQLLEIGCGNGDMLRNMEIRGWQVTGIDFDPKSIQAAKSKVRRVLLGGLEEQKFPENKFDSIIMSHVIEHVPDPQALLHECYRILKPGGKLVSVTPNSNGYNHNKFKKDSRILEPPRHLHIFNQHSLKNILNQNTFITKIYSTTHNYSGLWWSSKELKNNKKYEPQPNFSFISKLILTFKDFIIGYKLKIGIGEGDEIVVIATKKDNKE